MTDAALQLHPDRLLPADPTTRGIARRLYASVRDLPIISPHGHVPPEWIAEDVPFGDPTSLLISPDHYVTRLLHAHGVPLEQPGRRRRTRRTARAAWRALCTHWNAFRGTPSRFWLESELADIFGVTVRPSAAAADTIYDQVAETLRRPDFRPRALLDRFGIEVLATTDAPADDLAHHAAIRDDATIRTRVLPTFRPDRYLEPGRADWPELVDALAAAADTDTGDYKGFIAALEDRRRYFIAHGAVSADHSHTDVDTTPLDQSDAERIFTAARAGTATADEATALRRHLLLEMARMSVEDGLVMTLHPGVHRNHHTPTHARFGADVGADIPVAVEFTRGLQPLLDALRHRRRLPPRAVHPRRDRVLPGDRAAGGLLPERLRGRAVVVPRRARGDPPLPRRGHRDRRVRPHLGLHRRHPRVLLHPGPPRHVTPAGLRLPRRAGRHPPPRRGRGLRDGARPGGRQPEGGVQAVRTPSG